MPRFDNPWKLEELLDAAMYELYDAETSDAYDEYEVCIRQARFDELCSRCEHAWNGYWY